MAIFYNIANTGRGNYEEKKLSIHGKSIYTFGKGDVLLLAGKNFGVSANYRSKDHFVFMDYNNEYGIVKIVKDLLKIKIHLPSKP